MVKTEQNIRIHQLQTA